jgi:hypothetical protein
MDFYITDQKVVRLSIVSNGDGKKYLDIRQFYTDRNTDELKPTQKGIWIPLEDKEASAKRILFEGLKFLGMDKNEMATFLDEDELLGENS